MTQIILQPCGKGLPTEHYTKTVEFLVPLTRMEPFLAKSDFADLDRAFPAGRAAAWRPALLALRKSCDNLQLKYRHQIKSRA
jgi:hypothetical protein